MTALIALLSATIGALFIAGKYSARQEPPALAIEQNFSCGQKPNCVCSQGVQAPTQAIEPLDLRDMGNAEKALISAIVATGGEVVETGDGLIAAVYQSKLFGFVDDVAIRIDESRQHADIISQSRVGHSDLGANRKRVENIRNSLRVNATSSNKD